MTGFGRINARPGESCSNPGFDDRFTSPCCYADFVGQRSTCPNCGGPVECTVEDQPVAVCAIPLDATPTADAP